MAPGIVDEEAGSERVEKVKIVDRGGDSSRSEPYSIADRIGVDLAAERLAQGGARSPALLQHYGRPLVGAYAVEDHGGSGGKRVKITASIGEQRLLQLRASGPVSRRPRCLYNADKGDRSHHGGKDRRGQMSGEVGQEAHNDHRDAHRGSNGYAIGDARR